MKKIKKIMSLLGLSVLLSLGNTSTSEASNTSLGWTTTQYNYVLNGSSISSSVALSMYTNFVNAVGSTGIAYYNGNLIMAGSSSGSSAYYSSSSGFATVGYEIELTDGTTSFDGFILKDGDYNGLSSSGMSSISSGYKYSGSGVGTSYYFYAITASDIQSYFQTQILNSNLNVADYIHSGKTLVLNIYPMMTVKNPYNGTTTSSTSVYKWWPRSDYSGYLSGYKTSTQAYYYYSTRYSYDRTFQNKTLYGSTNWSTMRSNTTSSSSVANWHSSIYGLSNYIAKRVMDYYDFSYIAEKEYEIAYSKGAGDSGNMSNTTMVYNTAKKLSPNSFEKTGYNFKSWTNGSNTYTNEQSVTNLTTTHRSTVTLTAQWNANTYTVNYDINGGDGGSTSSNTLTYDTLGRLTPNSFDKLGYNFVGWSETPDGEVVYEDNDIVSNLTSENKGNITLYAQWEPIRYYITFNSNPNNSTGVTNGFMDTVEFTYDSVQALPENKFTKYTNVNTQYIGDELVERPSVFKGWSFVDVDLDEAFRDKQNVLNLTTTHGDRLTLYAIWDDTPQFTFDSVDAYDFPDRYFSLEEARSGTITEAELLDSVSIYDRESGYLETKTSEEVISSGSDEGITLLDYKSSDFTDMSGSGSVTITYKVTDDEGSYSLLTITVYITTNASNGESFNKIVRTIGYDYIDSEMLDGGLLQDSIWRTESNLNDRLKNSFNESSSIATKTYTSDELDYIRNH